MLRVKVCGMRSAEDVAVCVDAGVDALGFIFAPSPCRLSLAKAALLSSLVPPFIARVAVFANNTQAVVEAAMQRGNFDFLQFSGDETPGFCGSFGKPTIRVVRSLKNCARLDLLAARAAAVMLDSRTATRNGGTGIAVDRTAAAQVCRGSSLPFILAGGLTPDTVGAAVAAVRPWAVDVRSGVERDGKISAQLVRWFVAAAKGAADDRTR